MKQVFMVFIIFALMTAGLPSQELLDTGNRITAVSVTGLKRTKPHVIETPLQKFIGRDAGALDTNEVFAVVQSSGILETLSVELLDNQDEDGKILAVTVREKWTIFPIPIVNVNSSGWSAGGVLMDTNAFGVKDMMMVMGIFGVGDLMTSLMYIHNPNSIGELGWNVMGFFSLQENEVKDQTGERTLRRYNAMSLRPSVGLSYALSEHITPNLNISYRYITLRETENPLNQPGNGTQGISLSPGIGIRYNSWDGYFLNEKQISLRYDYTFVIEDDDVHSVSANAAFNHSIIPGFRFTAKSGAVFSTPSASPFFDSSPMNAAVNILPQNYSATSIAGISLGLEKYIFKFSLGTVTLSAAYQAVYSHSDLLANQADHGPVAMLQMYFSRLAIPGVGLGGAYSVDKNAWQYAFNIGMRF